MKIEIIKENESAEETIKFMDAHRNWSIEMQQYKLSKKEQKEHDNALLKDCKIYQRGVFLIIEYKNIIHFWENINSRYRYFEKAIHLMQIDRDAKWKTLKRLISFRQAIRETEVNCMGYLEDLLSEDKELTFKTYQEFMRLARKHDVKHHGIHTF